jgi:hypothetical protein
MTYFTCYVAREMYLQCGVEAENHEEATKLAMDRQGKSCSGFDDLWNGKNFSCWVYADGEVECADGKSFETEAGRLWDAAGELLGALEGILQEEDNISYHTPLCNDFWENARAAIAKAIGKEAA